MRHLRSKPENLNQIEITSQPVSKRTNSLLQGQICYKDKFFTTNRDYHSTCFAIRTNSLQGKKNVFSIQGLSNYCLAVIDDFQNLRSRSSWCGYNRESAGIYIYIQTYTYVYTHTHTYIHICSHRSLLPTHLHTYTPIQSSPRRYLGCDFVFPPLPFVNVRTWLTQRGCRDFFVLNLYFVIYFFLIYGRTWLDARGMPRRCSASYTGSNSCRA